MSLHLVEIHSVVSHFVKTFWPSICGFSLHRQHHLEFVLFRHLPTDSTVISARRNQISLMVKPSFSLIVLFCVYVFVLSLGKFSLNLSSQKVSMFNDSRTKSDWQHCHCLTFVATRLVNFLFLFGYK